jgi:ADP-ribose pyrophosphatase YjhB (NUDIX family)
MKKIFSRQLNFTKLIKRNLSNLTNDQMIKLISDNSKVNVYNGVETHLEQIITRSNNNYNLTEYIQNFELIFKNWEEQKIRSITIKIPNYLSNFISFFTSHGFYFHHTTQNDLYMCKWLDKTVKDKIPRYAHHHIGIGACILNKNLEFLLIKEKFIPAYIKNRGKVWKFVTGLIEEGESIEEAVNREVKEEVNLNIIVHGYLMMSESYPNHQLISDICFFNLCTLVDDNLIKNIQIDKDELSEAKFFNINEVDELLKTEQTSLLTLHTFNKLKPLLNFNKTLDENLRHLKNPLTTKLFKSNKIENANLKFSYLNIYN